MHIEISGRGQGKTYRMLLEAVKSAAEGVDVYIYSPFSQRLENQLWENITTILGEVSSERAKRVIRKIRKIRVCPPAEIEGRQDGRRFFEEFDYIDAKQYKPRDTDYLCGSPRKLREPEELMREDSVFNKALKHNNFVYVSKVDHSIFLGTSFLEEARATSEETFRTEYLAQFLK